MQSKDRSIIYMAEDSIGRQVGLVRFNKISLGKRLVSIIVAPDQRGKGYASDILKEGIRLISKHKDIDQLVAEITNKNQKSLRLFTYAGFIMRRSDRQCMTLVFSLKSNTNS